MHPQTLFLSVLLEPVFFSHRMLHKYSKCFCAGPSSGGHVFYYYCTISLCARGCNRVKSVITELKELNSSLTTEEMTSEIQELKAECSGYRTRLEKIKSATNHVTPEEKEKVPTECI